VIGAVTNVEHRFDVVRLPDPAPQPDELVIRVAACGVCGSDIKAQPFAPPGMVMGHELGGEVVGVGSVAGDWRCGMKAAVLPVISCGSCAYCVAGAVAHCAQVQYIGMGPAGGFAEFAVVPARHSFAVPADLPATFAALVEPFAVGLHAVHSAGVSTGDDVLIVGAGGVGLTTLAWALRKRCGRVTVVDPDSGRRESALAMGATDVLTAVSDVETNPL
jgi:(R,R)-butanediol dehydrogenase / meso-butanediol dehydrogenase / diacetyl reductase